MLLVNIFIIWSEKKYTLIPIGLLTEIEVMFVGYPVHSLTT